MQKAIAIDGPSGAGKSTVARLVGEELGFAYIDTGAMYRACTLRVLQNGTDIYDEAAVSSLLDGVDIRLGEEDGLPLLFLDGENVTSEIRGREVTAGVSVVCRYGAVREKMVQLQRAMAEEGGVVMDGRDIGTNVMPQALLKIFLTASIEERGHRRWLEQQQKSISADMSEDQVIEDLRRRDRDDTTREINPLVMAGDAVLLDSTGMEIREVVDKIVKLWRQREDGVL